MKNLKLIALFALLMSCTTAKKLMNSGQLVHYGSSENKSKVLTEFEDAKQVILLVNNDIYVPDSKCICGRLKGEDDLDRSGNDSALGRNSGNEDLDRKGGRGNLGRDGGRGGIGRDGGTDAEQRGGGAGDLGRTSGEDDLARLSGSDSSEREGVTDATGRDGDGDASGRTGDGDASGRFGGTDSRNLTCQQIDDCKMEIYNINPNSKISIVDKFQTKELNVEIIDNGIRVLF